MRRSLQSRRPAGSLGETEYILQTDYPVTIRAATLDLIPEIIRLERLAATAAHWSAEQYQAFLEMEDSPRLVVAAEADVGTNQGVVGFLVARHLAPEWELENIVVAPGVRGRGIGIRLMQELFDRAKQSNSRAVFLEVRESNVAARQLYKKLGFEQSGRRKSYYSNPVEDAVLYTKALSPLVWG